MRIPFLRSARQLWKQAAWLRPLFRPRVEILEDRTVPADFTQGNLVVLRLGYGKEELSEAAAAVFLDEYDTKGNLVQSIEVPTKDDGTNHILTNSGTALAEGALSRSADGQYLLFGGYNADVGTGEVGTTSTQGKSPVLRVVGRAAADGTIDTTTTTTAFNKANIYSVASTDGTEFWATGADGSIVYLRQGENDAGTTISSVGDTHVLSIYAGQLYVSTGVENFRLGTVGTGTPQKPDEATGLPGLKTSDASSFYAYYFADLSTNVEGMDTLYVADDGADTLSKYTFDGNTWNLTDEITGVLDVRGLTGSFNEKSVTLFATLDNEGKPDTLVFVTDSSGYGERFDNPNVETLATASDGTAFRGVALAPEARQVPQVSSITRADADPTRADSVAFTVTFSQPVTGVDAGDFTLTSSGISGASIADVTGSDQTWTVTVKTGSGSGTLRLDLVDDDSIRDASDTPLGGEGTGNGDFTAGEVYTIDKTAPGVSSVVRADANPSRATSVKFTVTFSESVTGVNSSDFKLTTSGVTGASITGVSGSGSTYTVTVGTGTGDGTIRLDVVDDDTIVDAAGNNLSAGFTTGQSYTIDKSAPSVSSINRADANPTRATSVHFTVTFSESVTGVDSNDFALTATGVTGASITGVSGSGTTYTVTVGTGSGDGSIRLDLNDDDSIQDAAGNKLGGTGTGNGSFTTGQSYTIDKTAPTVSTVVRAGANPTNATSVDFTVTFSESVTGVDADDFSLTSGVSGASITGVSGSGSSYTVTVDTGSGDGTVRLDVKDDDTITDAAGNTLDGGFTTGQSYTIDKTAPTVSTVVRAGANPTNASAVDFTVTFSESVTGVDATDFKVTTGLSGTSVSNVTGSGSTYTVTVDTGSGDGTLRLDVLADGTIKDAATNAQTADFTTGQTYTIDKTAPTVSSVVRADADPTRATSVHFTVTFSESVTGVDSDDFALTATGVTGASITGVSGSGSTYTVTVGTGSGDGSIRLDLNDDDSIQDAAGNKLGGTGTGNGSFTTGQSYTIDKTAPTVSTVVRAGANPTNATSVDFTVTFSESVTGVDADDFSLTSGVSGASITGVSGSGSSYTVTVDTGSGDGTVRLDVKDDDTITDAAGNTLDGGFTTGQSYTIDKTAPTVSTVVRAGANPTNASSVQFTVTFGESVSGVDSSDFALTTTGVSGASITGVSGTGSSYTVTVDTGSGDGTVRLDVKDDDTIKDAAGNTLGGTFTTGETYTIDKTRPTVSSVARADGNPTNATSVHFTVTFSESVTGVDSDDFSLISTGLSSASITNVSGSGTTWTVTVGTGSGDGTVRLDVVADDTIKDAAGNTLSGGFTSGQVYTIDKTLPTVSSVTRTAAGATYATSVDFTVTFSEAVTGVDSNDFHLATTGVSGAGITNVSGSGTSWTVTVNTGTGDGTVGLDVLDDDTIKDAAGNALDGGFTTGQAYTIDKTPPAVSSVNRADASPTNAGSVQFTVTFSESVTGVDFNDFSLTTGLSGASITDVSGSGSSYTVTVDTGSGDGTIRLNVLDDDSILDGAGNTLDGGFTTGQAYTIDKTAPQVSTVTRAGASPTNADSVEFTVTFSESVTGVDADDFKLTMTGVTGATVTNVSGSGTSWTVTVDTGAGDGTVRLDVLADDSITDAAGNPLGGGFTTGQSYTIDKTAPVVFSVNRADANPTNATSVQYTVTFSEAVTGVDSDDFTVTATGVIGASITGVTGSGSSWTVTVDTGSGDGSIRLDVLANDTISDAAGNPLDGSFTTGQVYTIDKTAPVVTAVTRADADPTNASSVQFTVTFSEAVTGVDTDDFSLTSSVSGASITNVSGSGNSWTVTVDTGAGDGTVRLNVLDDDTITDAVGNELDGGFTTGQAYTIDKTVPTVFSVNRASASPSNASSVDFTVTFSESVTGVDTDDFSLTTTGVVGANITNVSGSGTSWTVTVDTGTGDGTIRLNVLDDDTIADAAGNYLSGGFTTGQTYTIDKSAPTVSSVNRVSATPTNASSVDFTVTFSESVSGVDTDDFSLTTTGLSSALITGVSGSGTSWTVTVDTGSGDGTVRLDVLDDATITDGAGNALDGGFTTGQAYTIDKTAPSVSSVTRVGNSPTNAASVEFAVTFSEAVTGVDADDFILTTGLSGATITNVTGSGTSWTVTVATGSGDGTIRLDVLDDATIVDAAGNNLNGGFTTGQEYAIDKSLPAVSSVVRAGASPTNAASVQFTVTFSESVTGVGAADFNLTTTGVLGASVTNVSGSGSSYTVTVSTGTGDGTVRLDVLDDDSIADAAGNTLNGGFTTGQVYTIDKTAPTVASVNRADANPTNASSVQFTVTFSEAVTGVDSNDFSLTSSGISGASITGVSGAGNSWTVTVSTGSGDGTVRLDVLDDDTITDAAGTALNGGFTTGQSYTIDKTAPQVSSVTRVGTSPTNAPSVQFTVTFSEAVTGVDADDFALTTTGLSSTAITNVSGSGTTWTVTVATGSGDGTVRLDVVDDDSITDAAGNTLGAGFTTGQVYAIDKTAPSVTSVVRADANPTNAASVQFTVTFSETVTGVDAADFTLTTTGVTGASITGVSGSGNTRTVTVSTGSGEGTIRLDVVDDDTVVDGAGNTLSSSFTTGEAYTIDRPPAVTSVTRVGTSPTNAASVQFTVTFSESVTGVDSGDFSLTTTGVTGASITGVSGSGATWTVTVNTGTGSGTIRLDVVDDDTIQDGAGNKLGGAGNGGFTAGEVFTIDRTAPTVTAVTRAGGNPTGAAAVQFTVTFSEAVTGVDAADFALTTTGVTGANITGVSGAGTTWTVTVGAGTGDGTIRLDVKDDDTIKDAAGTALGGTGAGNGAFATGDVYTIQHVAPTPPKQAIVAAPTDGTSHIVVYDATTGQVKFSFFAFDPGFTGGARVALGDVNGDGVLDIIAAAGPGGGPHVKVFSGVDGGLIHSFWAFDPGFTGGVYVAAGDVDGDGKADIILGAGEGGGPQVKVVRGTDLATLFSFWAYDQGMQAGVRVAAGDMTGDGLADIFTVAGPGAAPHLKAFDGRSLNLLASFQAFDSGYLGGVSLAVGDLNKDGLVDIVLGASSGDSPHIKVFDGKTRGLLSSFMAGTGPGGVRVGVVDRGDLRGVVVTRGGAGQPFQARLLNGLTGQVLDEFFLYGAAYNGGIEVA